MAELMPSKELALIKPAASANEENSLFSLAEIAEGCRTQHQTCLCFQGCAETKPNSLQLCLLPFKAFSGMIQRKGTAENKLMILGNRPRAAICCFRIKNAGIKRVQMCFGEPLLYGKIPAQLLFGIERSSDDGICAVRPDEKFRSNGADLLCLQIL